MCADRRKETEGLFYGPPRVGLCEAYLVTEDGDIPPQLNRCGDRGKCRDCGRPLEGHAETPGRRVCPRYWVILPLRGGIVVEREPLFSKRYSPVRFEDETPPLFWPQVAKFMVGMAVGVWLYKTVAG